jgi:endonuclease/exonuclease/phosphatase family metal-dependent hydrolase
MSKIITTNMAIDNCNPEARYRRFNDFCLETRPDIIAVQEVSHGIGRSALQGLAEDMGGDYSFCYAEIYPRQEYSQGVGVVTNLGIRDHRIADPKPGMNRFQLLELETAGGQRLQLANVHAEAHLLLDGHRGLKLARLIRRLNHNVPQILAGDFNAIPSLPSIRYLKKRYRSAHETVHGREPSHTYPTDLGEGLLLDGGDASPGQIFAMKLGAKVFQRPENRRPSGLPRVVADYIFVNPLVEVKGVAVTGHESSELAHSDHLGLEAEIVLH